MASKPSDKDQNNFARELVDVSAEGALAAVGKVGADEQADLVEAWIAAGNIGAVAAVAREDDAPSPARKAARRGLNVMKARGLKVPEPNHVARPFALTDSSYDALFECPDVSGTSLTTIVLRRHGKDAQVVHVLTRMGAGVIETSGGLFSASNLKTWADSRVQARGCGPVPVPLAWARHRIKAALEENTRSRYPVPLGLDRFTDLLNPAPAEAPAHPLDALRAAMTEDEIKERATRSADLHGEPEFGAYVLPREAALEVLAKVGERFPEDPSTLSNDAMGVFLREESAAACDRLFTPEARQNLAQMMLDAGISVLARAGKEKALDVLAAREAVIRAGLVTDPPRDVPFLAVLVDKSISALARENQGRLDIPVRQRASASGLALSQEQIAAIAAAKNEPAAEGSAPAPEAAPAPLHLPSLAPSG
ncbi:MAG: hypothetical protein U0165_19745 [Polyangiaceae bacterium]